MSGRWTKGQSGNPSGRPKKRRPHISAFDIIFEKSLTVTQNGIERDLTIEEALQMQTYQTALKGRRMAIRQVLKMIEKREAALHVDRPEPSPVKFQVEHDSANANEAMLVLGIAQYGAPRDGGGPATAPFQLTTWAAQAAISRPGRKRLTDKQVDEIKRCTFESDKLKWPRSRA